MTLPPKKSCHDNEDGHVFDPWGESNQHRRRAEWQRDYEHDADLGHDAELEREVQEFESGVAAGFFSDDEQADIVRKLIKRGVSPDRIGIRKEDRDRASQTDTDQQAGTDKVILTDRYVEGDAEFTYEVSDRRQLSDLEIKRDAPVAFVERGLVSTAAGGYDLACELLRGYFLILENPMTKQTESIVSGQILSLVQGIEDRLRLALESLVLQLWQTKTLHGKAKGICKVCRAEPSNPFVETIVNAYGTSKEIGPDKQILRVEPSHQTIRRVLKRLGQTRNRPVRGRSAQAKASNLVARIQQTAPLLWIGKAAILRTIDFKGLRATGQGRVIGFGLLGERRPTTRCTPPTGFEYRWIKGWGRGTFSKTGRSKKQVTEKPIEKNTDSHYNR
jgi:hypothetical protein